ncbi:type IV toxin-antitoxin system AbiEi family antitoxin domain-containing protein [Pedococcus bigeumensis]|uniref:type IV toxin-antitoxin system AbiEi family antitoxin domain-containing protein n=1 Tax=Pedococcus bigeumensis TaxID=433644 RepID=UPI002FEC2A97
MDSSLLDLAGAQGGVITTAQLRTLGHTRESITALVRQGAIARLTRGVYAVGEPPQGPSRTVEWHRMLGRGAQLLYPDGALAAHSAMVALGLPVWGASLHRVHLERPVHREVITRDLVIRPPFDGDSAPAGVVPAAAGIVQHCLEHGATPGIVTADAALHSGAAALTDLEAAAGVVRGWPRSSRVRTMMALLDARSESVGESRLRVGLTLLGVQVEPQVVIRDEQGRFVARVDFLVKGTNVVIEFDGLVKYRDGGAAALVAEKRREDELRRLGYRVVRVIWSDLTRLGVLVARLRDLGVVCHRGIPEAGVRELASPHKGRLHPETVPG